MIVSKSVLNSRLVDLRDSTGPEKQKVVVAAESPWRGELYRTRPGNVRLPFGSVETFCSAFLTITGWSLQPTLSDRKPAGRGVSRRHSGDGVGTKRKFIIATTVPWTGEVYRTHRGYRHLQFTTFEDLLCAVLEITGWSLDHTATAAPSYDASTGAVSAPAIGPESAAAPQNWVDLLAASSYRAPAWEAK